jgi:hypothetical protein
MKQTFNPIQIIMHRNELITHIINIMSDHAINNLLDPRDPGADRDIIKFLTETTDPVTTNGAYDSIRYIVLRQKVPGTKRDVWINFQTTAYRHDNSGFLSKEYATDIAWCVVPVTGDIYPVDRNQYIVDPRPRDPEPNQQTTGSGSGSGSGSETVCLLDPRTYTDNIDNKYDPVEAGIRNSRTSRRNFIKRDPEVIEKKKTDHTVNEADIRIIGLLNPLSDQNQLELNNKTRASAQTIRDRFSGSYKMNRLRGNPELSSQYMSVDLRLRTIGKMIARENNKKLNSQGLIIMGNDWFTYMYDRLTVHKVAGILRFGPVSSGRLRFNHLDNDKVLYFITVMRHAKHLVITFHCIELI